MGDGRLTQTSLWTFSHIRTHVNVLSFSFMGSDSYGNGYRGQILLDLTVYEIKWWFAWTKHFNANDIVWICCFAFIIDLVL